MILIWKMQQTSVRREMTDMEILDRSHNTLFVLRPTALQISVCCVHWSTTTVKTEGKNGCAYMLLYGYIAMAPCFSISFW